MGRVVKILGSVLGTVWFNLRYLPLGVGWRLPVWVARNVRVKELRRGQVVLRGKARLGLVRIGYHEADGVDSYGVHTIISVGAGGKLVFEGDAHIGQGAVFRVNPGGDVVLGEGFAVSGTTTVVASKSIRFGRDVQLSWNSLIMDGDAHRIFDTEGRWMNPPREIVVGNKVWIAANTAVMKGAVIPDNTVVAGGSLVNRAFDTGNCILAGSPARVVRAIGGFEI